MQLYNFSKIILKWHEGKLLRFCCFGRFGTTLSIFLLTLIAEP